MTRRTELALAVLVSGIMFSVLGVQAGREMEAARALARIEAFRADLATFRTEALLVAGSVSSVCWVRVWGVVDQWASE